jgi:2'-hydroxyisoflavone reductase
MDKTRRQLLKTGVIGSAAVAAGCTTENSIDESVEAVPWRPLKVLILGGTGFIGPHMVREALRRGHEVELFNRGRTNSKLFPDLKLLVGDRNNGLEALEGGNWDVVIDNSGYVPREVADSARMLAPVVSHYLFISTISVYGEISGPIDEDTPVGKLADESIEEVTGESFGPLKALCEQRVISEMGADRTTVLRPTYICGPGDRTDRYSYWPVRSMRGGEMLWPGTPDDDIQIIDVRDLANFTLDSLEQKISGVFNTVTPKGSFKMGDLLEDCQAVTASDVWPTWVSPEFLKKQEGVLLPIWEDPAGDNAGLSKVDGSRAALAGLKNRPTRETARDTVAWWKTLPPERTASTRAGLSAEKEAELLSLWHDQQA